MSIQYLLLLDDLANVCDNSLEDQPDSRKNIPTIFDQLLKTVSISETREVHFAIGVCWYNHH
jgi:hypothetical protein